MKFDFWFELPEALANIHAEALDQDDKNNCILLVKSLEVWFPLFRNSIKFTMPLMKILIKTYTY